jgi:hypothetical protein
MKGKRKGRPLEIFCREYSRTAPILARCGAVSFLPNLFDEDKTPTGVIEKVGGYGRLNQSRYDHQQRSILCREMGTDSEA